MAFLQFLSRVFSFIIIGTLVSLGGFLLLPSTPPSSMMQAIAAEDAPAETPEAPIIIETRSKDGLPRSNLYVRPTLDLPEKSPAWRMPLFQINALSAQDLSDEVMVVNFFAVWCPKCAKEMPILTSLSAAHNIPVYGVNIKIRESDDLDVFFETNGNPFKKWGKDDFHLMVEALNIGGLPVTMIVTKDRKIHWRFKGELTQDRVDTEMLPLIQKLSGQHIEADTNAFSE